MIFQGREISKWGKNVYVKVPVTNSKGKFMGKVINELNCRNIKLNITAVYSSKQTSQILKNINKKTKVIISIFAGRMADTGIDPIPQFKESIKISKKYKNVEILWASTREPYNFIQAKIRMPSNNDTTFYNRKLKILKSFKQLTIDTVNGFVVDQGIEIQYLNWLRGRI